MKNTLYLKMRQLEDEHWWFVARREILAVLLRRLALPEDAEILEVGCGTGGNIRMLKQFGNLVCIERDRSAAELAQQRGDAKVLSGSLPDALPELENQFDLIALFDVIEHIDDDLASLQALACLLKPGGKIVITVPAFRFLWSQHDDENEHKRRYIRKSLELLSKNANLQVNYISYFNTLLFLPVAAVRLFRKIIPYQETWKDMSMPKPAVNGFLRQLFRFERFLIGWAYLPFGISLCAVLSTRDQ